MSENVRPQPDSHPNPANNSTETPKFEGNLKQLLNECKAMMAHSLDGGLKVPPNTFGIVEQALSARHNDFDLEALVTAHHQLSELVKPATPTSITFLAGEQEKPKTLGWFFPRSVSVARSMTFVGVTSIVVFCIVLVLVEMDASREVTRQSGLPHELLHVIYLLVAASLGASFLALYQANSYIVARTFHPKFISSYYYRYVLGLMAGMILANLVPGFETQGSSAGNGTSAALAGFTKPVLAMIGGFSASVVYRILFRLVDAVESIVRGDTKDMIDAELMQERARLKEADMGAKMRSAGELLGIRESLIAPGNTDAAIKRLDKLIASTLPPTDA